MTNNLKIICFIFMVTFSFGVKFEEGNWGISVEQQCENEKINADGWSTKGIVFPFIVFYQEESNKFLFHKLPYCFVKKQHLSVANIQLLYSLLPSDIKLYPSSNSQTVNVTLLENSLRKPQFYVESISQDLNKRIYLYRVDIFQFFSKLVQKVMMEGENFPHQQTHQQIVLKGFKTLNQSKQYKRKEVNITNIFVCESLDGLKNKEKLIKKQSKWILKTNQTNTLFAAITPTGNNTMEFQVNELNKIGKNHYFKFNQTKQQSNQETIQYLDVCLGYQKSLIFFGSQQNIYVFSLAEEWNLERVEKLKRQQDSTQFVNFYRSMCFGLKRQNQENQNSQENLIKMNNSSSSPYYRTIQSIPFYINYSKQAYQVLFDQFVWQKISQKFNIDANNKNKPIKFYNPAQRNPQKKINYRQFVEQFLQPSGNRFEQNFTQEETNEINFQLSHRVFNISIYNSSFLRITLPQNKKNVFRNIFSCNFKQQRKDNKFQCIDVVGYESNDFYVMSSVHYKWYFIAKNGMKGNVKIKIADIERLQLQQAKYVFEVIMLTFSLIIVVLIAIITLRPVIRLLLIYYGYIEDSRILNYPLGYFNLKIKLKKMKQNGYLSYYVKNTNSNGMLTEQVSQIPSSQSETQQNSICCFCLEQIRLGETVAQLYCNHEFHGECFNEWAKNQPNTRCPSCRREFTRRGFLQFQRDRINV